ncbi:retrovirus-related Pol polyprotein from transposon TNT 1-94, partial [Trifolium pratense]
AEESKLKDLKVKNYLFQSIDRSILETILVRGTSRDIWESMRRKYQGSNKVKRAQLQSLRRDFEILCMKEDESVTDFFARTLAIANKMTSHGERLTDGNIVEKILRSMTSKFEYVVCSIEESHDVTTMSIDELQSSLLVHEGRMKIHKVKEEEQALKVSNSNLGRGSANSRGRGRTSSRGRGRGGRSAANTSKEFVECYRCHKLGHYQNECPTWEENANFAEFDEHEEMLMMAQDQSHVNTNQVWFLDSGCSNHMIGTKEWLFDYDDTFRETV